MGFDRLTSRPLNQLAPQQLVLTIAAAVLSFVYFRTSYKVVSGQDLTEKVSTWNTATSSYNPPAQGPTYAFDRFCSADLPAISAYYDARSRTGTKDRIFMNGEETTNGRAWAHVVNITRTTVVLACRSWQMQMYEAAVSMLQTQLV